MADLVGVAVRVAANEGIGECGERLDRRVFGTQQLPGPSDKVRLAVTSDVVIEDQAA